jgi:hypothetical protein
MAQSARFEIGALTCSVARNSAANAEVKGKRETPAGQSRNLHCSFKPYRAGPEEKYSGSLQIVGAALESFEPATLMWAVRSSSIAKVSPGILQQTYAADALRATGKTPTLLGESNKSITLHSMSEDAQAGKKAKLPPDAVIIELSLQLATTPA